MFTDLSSMLTFLSILVYRRTLVAETDYKFARGTHLIQSYAYADVLNRGSRFATLAQPVLGYRLGNVGGYDYAEVFVDGYLDLLAYAHRGGMSTATYEYMKQHHLRTHVLQMMVNFKR